LTKVDVDTDVTLWSIHDANCCLAHATASGTPTSQAVDNIDDRIILHRTKITSWHMNPPNSNVVIYEH